MSCAADHRRHQTRARACVRAWTDGSPARSRSRGRTAVRMYPAVHAPLVGVYPCASLYACTPCRHAPPVPPLCRLCPPYGLYRSSCAPCTLLETYHGRMMALNLGGTGVGTGCAGESAAAIRMRVTPSSIYVFTSMHMLMYTSVRMNAHLGGSQGRTQLRKTGSQLGARGPRRMRTSSPRGLASPW